MSATKEYLMDLTDYVILHHPFLRSRKERIDKDYDFYVLVFNDVQRGAYDYILTDDIKKSIAIDVSRKRGNYEAQFN